MTGNQSGEPHVTADHLASTPLPADTVGLLEGLSTTRAIRRYHDEPVPAEVLRAILFAATRAPTGSNRQQFRFITLTDGPKAHAAKELIAGAARDLWKRKQDNDGYQTGSGLVENSPKARMAATMPSRSSSRRITTICERGTMTSRTWRSPMVSTPSIMLKVPASSTAASAAFFR